MYLGNIMMLVLNLLLIYWWVKILKIPYPVLFIFIFVDIILLLPVLPLINRMRRTVGESKEA